MFFYVLIVSCLLVPSLGMAVDGGVVTTPREKSYAIRQEINTFVERSDTKKRLHIKSDFVRFMLNTIDKSMVIADQSSAWDRGVNTFFYNVFPGGDLETESTKGLLLLSEGDAPQLHACLGKLCKKVGMTKPLIFLNCDKDFLNAEACSFGKNHALIIVGKELIDKMSDQGVSGTIAHELAHIKHNHTLKLMVTGLMTIMLVTYLCEFRWGEKIKFAVQGACIGTIVLGVIYFLTRSFEKQADNMAIYKFDEPENFVESMEELDHAVRDEFETYKKEFERLQNSLQTLQAKSPKMAKFLSWIARLYDKITRYAYEDELEGDGGDHPSFKDRIEVGKAAVEERAANEV